jgi:hypothetical protein
MNYCCCYGREGRGREGMKEGREGREAGREGGKEARKELL